MAKKKQKLSSGAKIFIVIVAILIILAIAGGAPQTAKFFAPSITPVAKLPPAVYTVYKVGDTISIKGTNFQSNVNDLSGYEVSLNDKNHPALYVKTDNAGAFTTSFTLTNDLAPKLNAQNTIYISAGASILASTPIYISG